MHSIFKKWNEGELQSYLVEITANIFLQKDDMTGNDLVDMILDKAGSKGTGKWTSQEAMELPVAIPTIDTAVAMRTISAFKLERSRAAMLYQPQVMAVTNDKETFMEETGEALYAAIILCYAQGLSMLHHASIELKMDIPLKDVVKIWRGAVVGTL